MRRMFLLFVLLLGACAAQQTTPVALSQPGDATLSCEQIAAEIARNETEAVRLAGADEDVVSGNIVVGPLAMRRVGGELKNAAPLL